MKKLVLVLVCALVMTVFIAFNYLLWDRENRIKSFEYLNFSKKASIDALNTDIKELDNINKQLKKRIGELEENNKIMQEKNSQLVEEKLRAEVGLAYKDQLIDKLLPQVNLKVFEGVIGKWVQSLNEGAYEEAYELMLEQPAGKKEALSLEDFTKGYKDIVNSINLKSVKLEPVNNGSDKKGDIVLRAELEAKIAEDGNSVKGYLIDGLNEACFIFDYSKDKDQWYILDILYSR